MGEALVATKSSYVESASSSSRGNSLNVPKPSGPQDGSIFYSNLPSVFPEFLKLAILSIISLAFSVWFIYTESVNPAPVPKYMVLDPGTTIAIIAFLSCLVTAMIVLLVVGANVDFLSRLLITVANRISPWLLIPNDRPIRLIDCIKALAAQWPLGFWVLQA